MARSGWGGALLVWAVCGCAGGVAEPTSASTRWERCEPNHEPALPESFACVADVDNGFTVYEWVVDRGGPFKLEATAAPGEELVAPILEVLGEDGGTVAKESGDREVTLRSTFAPGRYSVTVRHQNAAATHLRLSAAPER